MIKTAIFDLDGTLFLGRTPIQGAAVALEKLRLAGVRVLFMTNAGTMTREQVAQKLNNIGLQAVKNEIYCGSYLVSKHISGEFSGKAVFVVGEKGMVDELKAAGVKISDDAEVVVVSLDRHLEYGKLATAHGLLKKGAAFIASNADHTFPTEHGSMPGAGAIVAALEFSSRRKAHVLGKPDPFAFSLMESELGLERKETIMVGDRLDTDVAFAKNAGIKSALVLTGISKKEDIKESKARPDYVFPSVAELILP